MAGLLLPSASKSKKPSYYIRKMEAYKAYGKALSKPQSNFKSYLLEKRKLNFGYIERENTNLNAIKSFALKPAELVQAPPSFPENPVEIGENMVMLVTSDEDFNIMMQDLERAHEFTLDAESNNEHSYYGMTCLLQIGTYEKIYLIDPFPQFENIRDRLKYVLESPKKLKVVHGGDNDYIAMNRDFGISMAGVVDLQFMQQQIFLICLELQQKGKIDEIRENPVLWNSATDEKGNVQSTAALCKLATDRIGLKDIAKLYFPSYPQPPDATLADWRIRPLEDARMINYAAYDAYIVLHIWNKLKQVVQAVEFPEYILHNAITETSKLLLKHFALKPDIPLDKKLWAAKLVPADKKMFELIYLFRQNQAKILDESEEEFLKLVEINKIIQEKPANQKQLEMIIQRSRPIPSESIHDTSKPLLKLLAERETFYKKMMDTKCHVCNGKYEYPHVAWGCIEAYSQRAVNAYMARPENAAFQQKEYERRVKNWHNKRGGNVPYPFPPPK